MTYRPLPDYLTIKPSNIEGLGLFATENIKDNTEIGITHVYRHFRAKNKEDLIRTPLGGFINHLTNPNCELIYSVGEKNLKTIRDIQAGEELTLKYKMYKVDNKPNI
jgi:SET domain-containing protein